MSAFRLLGTAALLLTVSLPATAQQVISEPGYCAFFYPNANCQNKGSGNPYTDSNYQRGNPSGETVGVAIKRSRKSAARLQ